MTVRDAIKKFVLEDRHRSLFPLRTNELVIRMAEPELVAMAEKSAREETAGFLPQQRVYAEKSGYHLRRTVKLDPVAEYFLYAIVYRHRAHFRKSRSPAREAPGYRIVKGEPLAGTSSYQRFRKLVRASAVEYEFAVTFDVASYFNSLYHHDIIRWFEDLGATSDQAKALGLFLRQINSGRSVDCLPQGIYPAKMIGHHFLKIVDDHSSLRSECMVRFMDDFYLFSDDVSIVRDDFYRVQEWLGAKGLSVNPAKTKWHTDGSDPEVGVDIDRVKVELLRLRRDWISGYDGDEGSGESLSEEQVEYLNDLLRNDSISEEDAELVLSLFDEELDDVFGHVAMIVGNYPNLAKRVHSFCARVSDKDSVTRILVDRLKDAPAVGEFQLFWFASMLEDYLLPTSLAGELFHLLLEAPRATPISAAKVLEISEKRFGMPDRREQYLRSGRSDWLAWAAAVGAQDMPKATRNQLLKYMQKASEINRLVSTAVHRL